MQGSIFRPVIVISVCGVLAVVQAVVPQAALNDWQALELSWDHGILP